MKEARFYFGCCAFENKSIYVFGGMNENLVLQAAPGQSKWLNSIERYTIVRDEWDLIQLTTQEKFPFCSHVVAVNLPSYDNSILIVGGQTYN